MKIYYYRQKIDKKLHFCFELTINRLNLHYPLSMNKMNKRLKLYTYILLLANILLLAHSFIPHNHKHELEQHEVTQTSNICECAVCSSNAKSLEESLSNDGDNSDDNGCGCCNNGKETCVISFGYLGQTDHESIFQNNNITIDLDYYVINNNTNNICKLSSREKLIFLDTVKQTQSVDLYGIGMRAPPILIS